MIGQRTDLLALLELLDERWVVGDLGCGTGHVSEVLAPCVGRVIAVDESGPMLSAAREPSRRSSPTSSCVPVPSKICRSRMESSTWPFSFSSRISSPTRRPCCVKFSVC